MYMYEREGEKERDREEYCRVWKRVLVIRRALASLFTTRYFMILRSTGSHRQYSRRRRLLPHTTKATRTRGRVGRQHGHARTGGRGGKNAKHSGGREPSFFTT